MPPLAVHLGYTRPSEQIYGSQYGGGGGGGLFGTHFQTHCMVQIAFGGHALVQEQYVPGGQFLAASHIGNDEELLDDDLLDDDLLEDDLLDEDLLESDALREESLDAELRDDASCPQTFFASENIFALSLSRSR